MRRVAKFDTPEYHCQKQAEDLGRMFYTISVAPPGDQIHDAKKLHKLMIQALERYDHWAGRILDVEWLEALWTPLFAIMLRCCDALEAHLAVYPDPEIARTVEGYRKAMADFEQHQTTPGVIEVPFEAN